MTDQPTAAPALRAVAAPGALTETLPPHAGQLPELAFIPVEALRFDERYQRPLGPGNWASIRKIAGAFSWSRFTPLLVAPVPDTGLFVVVDGQHRAHAAALRRIPAVPAMIVPMDLIEQASAFQWVNGQVVRVHPLQVYRAALTAGEGWARRIDRAVAEAGCRMMTTNYSTNQKKPGMVFCIGLIRQLCDQGHAEGVTAALAALRQYDQTGRVALYSDYVLSPWLKAAARHPGRARVDLVAILRANDPFRVIEGAQRLRDAGEKITATAAFAALINKAVLAARGRA